MARDSRVAWHEGLFLRPQHFQQQERYFDSLSRALSGAIRPYPWGIRTLSISESHASRGQFSLEQCTGILPDGTPFSLPADQPLSNPLDVPADTRDAQVYLTLHSRLAGATEFIQNDKVRADVRVLVSEEEVLDAFSPERAAEPIEIGTLNLNYGITRPQTDGRVCLALARIHEVVNGQVMFDKRHIPPLLDVRGSPRVQAFLNDIVGRLDQRVEELAIRSVDSIDGGTETIASFLMLQALNRVRPMLLHLRALPGVHPERLYEVFASLAGELSTFTRPERRPPAFPDYDHENLQMTFEPVFESLQQSLSVIFEKSAGQLRLEAVGPGAYTARIDDHSRFQTCSFYLAASARVPSENLRTRFPSVVKIGTVQKMREIVGSSLQPGVRIAPANMPPSQIRLLPGFTYFELDRSSRDWAELTTAPAMGIHVAGDWPELKLELWWVKR